MMNVMTYKGYKARVEFDPRDNIFVGRVLGIEDGISFHGETVAR
jgi:predicted HicB family RNase H-like nuclease